MSSISGVSGNSNSYFQQTGNTQRRERDTSKIADNVFSKLDTKNQGYLEVQDLETAFSNIASNSTGSNSSATGSRATGTSSSSSSVNDLFKKLDSDGDGKLTKTEFSDGIKKLSDALEGQFNARRTRGPEGAPPPPPPSEGEGGADKAGLDKAQLTDLSAKVGQSNSGAAAALSQVAQHFEAADTNQDGKVSLQETLAYLEKSINANSGSTSTNTTTTTISASSSVSNSASSSATDSSNTSATSSTSDGATTSSTASSSTDVALFKKALQLLRAYNSPATASGQSIAVSA